MDGCVIKLRDVQLKANDEGNQRYRATLPRELAGAISGGWYAVKANTANHWDVHPENDEYYFIARGGGIMQIDDREYAMEYGDTVCVPRGARHRIVNDRNEDLELFFVYSPAPERMSGPVKFHEVAG
jgi:mannose-6-phosphate isomerase-like protein (cupin superfamily)